jgi:hypothetical protein
LPSCSKKMFSGLMSRWMMPRACRLFSTCRSGMMTCVEAGRQAGGDVFVSEWLRP